MEHPTLIPMSPELKMTQVESDTPYVFLIVGCSHTIHSTATDNLKHYGFFCVAVVWTIGYGWYDIQGHDLLSNPAPLLEPVLRMGENLTPFVTFEALENNREATTTVQSRVFLHKVTQKKGTKMNAMGLMSQRLEVFARDVLTTNGEVILWLLT